jgi:CBS domain-containing protein
MKTRELMVQPAVAVHAGDSLAHAASLLRDHDCGSLAVVASDGRIVAMLTDRDICLAALRTDRPLTALEVGQAMSRVVHCCGPDDDVAQVQDEMSLHQVRRLPVVDENRRPLGVVSIDDIARAAQRQSGLIAPPVGSASVGRTLAEICRPHLVVPDEERAP